MYEASQAVDTIEVECYSVNFIHGESSHLTSKRRGKSVHMKMG